MILHALESGESHKGIPLVILHGLMGSADNWRSALKAWGSERWVIALDLRNHGRSGHIDGMCYTDMAADVIETLDNMGIDHVELLGHSMGGKVAIAVACHYAQRVDKLIVVDVAPVQYQHDHADVIKAMRAVEHAGVSSRSDADKIMQPYLPDIATRQFIATNLVRSEDGGLEWRVGLDAIEEHYADISAKPVKEGSYSKPVLFVRGARSHYVNDNGIEVAKAMFDNLEVVTLDTGHWVHAERFEEFKAAVDRFLAES